MNKQHENAALAATFIPFMSLSRMMESSVILRPGLPVPLVEGFPPIIYTPWWSNFGPCNFFRLDQKNHLKSKRGPSGPTGQGEFQHIAHVCARACVYSLSFFLISIFNYITKYLDHLDHALFFKHLHLDHFLDHLDHLDHADYKD